MKPIPMLPPIRIGRALRMFVETRNYAHDMLNVPDVWLRTKGNGIKVAVIDTGRPRHRDLPNIVASRNCTSTAGTTPEDKQGHATHCCGIVGARTDENHGLIGIAPAVELITAKALDDEGRGSDDWLADAIDWSLDQGADILSLSLGAPAKAAPLFRRTEHALINAFTNGKIIVVAAGNSNATVGFPALMEEVISIGAVNGRKERAWFSNKGRALDFAAPGIDIWSTFLDNTYCELSGTSMACPQVAGLCALILSEHRGEGSEGKRTPIRGVPDMIEHLKRIAYDLGPEGWDGEFGYGMPIFGHTAATPPTKKKSFWRASLQIILDIINRN